MGKIKDVILFKCIHDYFKVYLPEQRNCSENTIRSYRKAINSFLDYIKKTEGIELSQITFSMFNDKTITAFLDFLEKGGNSISTRNQRMNSIRAFCGYAAKMEPTAISAYSSILTVPAKKDKKKNVEYMTPKAVQAILSSPDPNTLKGLRDQFMLLMFYDTGARVNEILKIKVCDIRSGATTESYSVILHGKGSKIRSVPLLPKTVKHLMNYCNAYHDGYNPLTREYLFYTKHKSEKSQMSDDNVRKLMRKYAKIAHESCSEVPLEMHPHLWRHTRAMHLYQSGMDLTMVSQWLGHSQLDTTLIYAHADTEQKRKAIEQAMKNNNPLSELISADRYTVNEENMLRKLYGLA